MSRTELLDYNNTQIHEIDKHKWIESEKAGKDLGVTAILQWIENYSSIFRKEWEDRKSK